MAVSDVGVDLGRRDIRVAQHLLNGTEVSAMAEQVRRKSVTEDVRADFAFFNVCIAGQILEELGEIETGVRQMIRRLPLEVAEVTVGSVRTLRVPTLEETLRVKAYLVVSRNQTRDYLDVVALAGALGTDRAAATLSAIDEYYADQHGSTDGIATQLVRQLGEGRPSDSRTTRELARYKNLEPRWHDWDVVVDACRRLAGAMLRAGA